MVVQRGDIWWADLSAPSGSEPGFRHPVLIVQSDDFNRSLIRTVVAAVITSTLRLAQAPGNVLLPCRISHLPKNSVINVSQLVTIDRQFLVKRISRLSASFMAEVEDGIRLVLSL